MRMVFQWQSMNTESDLLELRIEPTTSGWVAVYKCLVPIRLKRALHKPGHLNRAKHWIPEGATRYELGVCHSCWWLTDECVVVASL